MGKFVDLTSKVFNKLTVIRREGTDKRGNALWLCECSCHEQIIVDTQKLTKGIVDSCEKCKDPVRGRIKDLRGHVFGRLTVLELSHINKKGNAMWLCRCSCGVEKVISAAALKGNSTFSCGCHRREMMSKRQKTHGRTPKRLYNIWQCMKERCYYEKHTYYHLYGGRGIVICPEWKDDYVAFRDWALGNGYAENLTIDRIDNDGNYCPENCRWITRDEQVNNKRTNVMITYMGKTQSLADWCRELGLSYKRINSRNCAKRNRPPEELFQATDRSRKMIEHDGRIQCVADWCREYELDKETVYDRMKHHPDWTFEQLFKPARKRRK